MQDNGLGGASYKTSGIDLLCRDSTNNNRGSPPSRQDLRTAHLMPALKAFNSLISMFKRQPIEESSDRYFS
jgi:hypothetical protein